MALETKWDSVPTRTFTQSGQSNGYIVINSTAGFKVRQTVEISALNLPTIRLEVKVVLSPTIMILGRVDKPITDRFDLSIYTILTTPTIQAEEQLKSKITVDDQSDATYARAPIVARRVHSVDEYGRSYNKENSLPVQESGHLAVDTAVLAQIQTLNALGLPLPITAIISTGNELIVGNDGTILI